MWLSIKAMSSVSALLWGGEHSGCVLDAHRNASLRRGRLDGISSIYPGFHG